MTRSYEAVEKTYNTPVQLLTRQSSRELMRRSGSKRSSFMRPESTTYLMK